MSLIEIDFFICIINYALTYFKMCLMDEDVFIVQEPVSFINVTAI
jgi:hypothetical protein